MNSFRRSEENPVLIPNSENAWEAEAAFNCCPVKEGRAIHFLYRAVSAPQKVCGTDMQISSIGYALSADGIHFKNRKQFIKPEYEWEQFGCEDPRVTRLMGRYYIFYTALSRYPFSAEGIKIGVAITKDFEEVIAKHPVTPFNAKAMALFPEKIRGKMAAVLTANTDKTPARIGVAFFDHEEQIWSREYWENWYLSLDEHALFLQRSRDDHIEVGAPPIKTKYGWLLIYSYIQKYFSPPAIYGVEAVLLDLENPTKIVARTEKPLLVPQESYEKYGRVPNIIFPSGAFVSGGKLYLYYSATDTACAVATANLRDVVDEMLHAKIQMTKMERFPGNPIIQPKSEHPWESKAVFNPAALYAEGKVHLVYRAMSEDNTSVMGYASSADGFKIEERLPEPIYVPREDFEKKGVPGGNTGCEDPRLTMIDDTLYMLYTAFDGESCPRVAITSIAMGDFLARRWDWAKPVLISPPGIMDKDAAIFPRKINGKYAILHRLYASIWLDFVDSLDFDGKTWLKGKIILSPDRYQPDIEKVGIAGPPIETEKGWLLIYHAVSKTGEARRYFVKAALLDLDDPTRVIARTRGAILEPAEPYEREGQVADVVFPCGSALINNQLFVYYGGADKVIGVATIGLPELLEKIATESHHREENIP